MVATAVFEEDHTPLGVKFVMVVVAPSQTVLEPDIASTTGIGVTVTTAGAEVVEQPFEPVIVSSCEPLLLTKTDEAVDPLVHA